MTGARSENPTTVKTTKSPEVETNETEVTFLPYPYTYHDHEVFEDHAEPKHFRDLIQLADFVLRCPKAVFEIVASRSSSPIHAKSEICI